MHRRDVSEIARFDWRVLSRTERGELPCRVTELAEAYGLVSRGSASRRHARSRDARPAEVEHTKLTVTALHGPRPVVAPPARVRDGMHRGVAAMRTGIDIRLRSGEPHMDGYNEQDEYAVTAAAGDAAGFNELMVRMFELASFRSGDGFWMRCDTASGDSAKGQIRLLLPRRAQRRDAIAAEFAERLRDAGIDAEVAFSGEI